MKKYVAIVLAFVICVGTFSFQATATAEASGTFGNLSWVLDAEGTLTISGEGEMDSLDPSEAWKQYNGDIKTVIIQDGVTSIGSFAFEYCHSLKSISIPNSVTMIGDDVFFSCTSLASITIPDSVTSIGWEVFINTAYYNNKSNWENGALYIDNWLIAVDNDSEGEFTIKAGTKSIGGSAFRDCALLTSINIPNSLTSIGYNAFENCSSLKSIAIPDSVTSIGWDAFYHCTSLASITIPDSVTSIGKYAFDGCSSLASITIPNSITHISYGMFSDCTSLTSITIPSNVKTVDFYAFSGCTSLETVYYIGYEEEWRKVSILEKNNLLKNANIVFKPRYTLGDVNDDGEIDNLDAAMILKYDAGIIDSVNELAADVNNDGASDNLDAAMILKYDAGIINGF